MTSSRRGGLRRAAGLLALCLLCANGVRAQQDQADRLWQGTEQQLLQSRRQQQPVPPESAGAYDSALLALTRTPRQRLQQLTFAVLDAVNRGDWFGADRLLRAYVQVPGHDPALGRFVAAHRAGAAGDHAAAIAGLRSVLRDNPLFVRAELDLARALYADQRLGDARQVFARLRTQPLPPEILAHIDAYLGALRQRVRTRLSLSVSGVREDNLNSASTVVDPCALVFFGACLPNVPNPRQAASGIAYEAVLDRLWPLQGNHGVLVRSINYGNRYPQAGEHDSLVSTTYLGWQYASARQQLQLLPLFEFDREGGRKIYHAHGLRASASRQLGPRAQLELGYEFKARRFTPALQSLQGHFRGLSLFGSYALRSDLVLYGSLAWRRSDAALAVFGHREQIARLGLHKSFGAQVTLNAAYGHRRKQAQDVHPAFGRQQRDHENSLYLSLALPGQAWQGLTPQLSYEHRHNSSAIAHVYSYARNRLTLGLHKLF